MHLCSRPGVQLLVWGAEPRDHEAYQSHARLRSSPPVNLGVKSVELGKAFRDLYDKANASWRKKYGAITEKKDRGYLPRPEWDFYYEGLLHHRKLWKIRNMKRYGLRHKHLLKFIEETK